MIVRNIPRHFVAPLSESHQQGTSLETIITFALFAIFYKDFFDCFETYPALRAPLSERGGCRITIFYISVSYIYAKHPYLGVVI